MSIKIKIPIIIVALLLFNTVALYLYINYYFFIQLADRIEQLTGIHISKNAIRHNKFAAELIQFEVIILVLIILLLGIIIYLMYSKPLAKLNHSVKRYKIQAVESTKRKDEIGQLQNSFALLSSELAEEKQTQNRIIASISHDLRTPLTSVLGYSENLIKKDLPEDRVKQYLKVIHSRAKDIDELLQDFVNYIEGKLSMELQLNSYSIAYIEEMLRKEYQEELESHGISFRISNYCKPSVFILIDLAKIRRVFANLIGNSLKHNKNNPKLCINIEISKSQDVITFLVSDNGKGIEPEDLLHVFEPFYTTDPSRSVSGLGLSICQNIIEAHSGEITVENNENGGLSIRFTVSKID